MRNQIAVAVVVLMAGVAGAIASITTGISGSTGVRPSTAFVGPTVHGHRIDIRLAEHMQADPFLAAGRFCMDRGYSRVVDYVIRKSGATITLGDEHVHRGLDGSLTAFERIECGYKGALG